MNKQLSPDEMLQIAMPIPQFEAAPAAPAMTRREKLMRWAAIVREQPLALKIFHRLEYWPPHLLEEQPTDYSAFALAAADPVLREAGLRKPSVAAAMKFFEMDRDELHPFSCDCGGAITNTVMADRIKRIANPGLLGRFSAMF